MNLSFGDLALVSLTTFSKYSKAYISLPLSSGLSFGLVSSAVGLI